MKKKEANFQFVKIIAMLMIISHHIVSKNAFNIDTEVVGIMVNKIALQVMGNNAFIGNNLFFLVSAWFLSSKKEEAVNTQYSLSSCLRIEKTVLFYSYAMCAIMLIFMGGVSKSILLKSIFPVTTGMWWYPTTYMIFLMIWPFYHQALFRFSDEDLKKFVLIAFSIWSISTLIPFANAGSSNLIAFLMLYAIVILIRRQDISFQSYSKMYCVFIVIPYMLAVLSIIVLDLLGTRIDVAAQYSCYFMRGNFRPVSMIVSIGLFMWASTWKLRPNKTIDWLADATFGIYLFHMYPPVMKILFEKIFVIQDVIDKPYAVLWLIVITMVIFSLGVMIDTLRKALFNVCNLLLRRFKSRIAVELK